MFVKIRPNALHCHVRTTKTGLSMTLFRRNRSAPDQGPESKPMSSSSETQKTSSPDYPLLAQKLLETFRAEPSGDAASSKLPCGLYIVATPIGHLGDITLRGLVTLASVDTIACEDTRVSGGLLAKYGIKKPLIAYHDHNTAQAGARVLEHIAAGRSVALVSDAGMPLISDPGYPLVRACCEAGYGVTVIPGANAAITALAGSGLPTDRFTFAGFLPPKSAARRTALTALRDVPGTIVVYETSPRLATSLADAAAVFGATRQVVVARELTKFFEETRRGSLGELAEFYAAHEVKGEIVILFAPAEKAAEFAAHDLDALLTTTLRDHTLRDAVAVVSDITGMKKSVIYARALQITSGGRG